jgi:hypothetical protein
MMEFSVTLVFWSCVTLGFFNSVIWIFFSVCACGKWICTSNKCSEGYTDIFKNTVGDEMDVDDDNEEEGDEEGDYADDGFGGDDEEEDEEGEEADTDPEDDPDVQDINWF